MSFDTNIRVQLLKTPDIALEVVEPFLALADIVFTGSGDLDFLFSDEDRDRRVRMALELCPRARVVVVKCGAKGATAYLRMDGCCKLRRFRSRSWMNWGGDAFDAAFLACVLKGKEVDEALLHANAAGAIAVTAKEILNLCPPGGYRAVPCSLYRRQRDTHKMTALIRFLREVMERFP